MHRSASPRPGAGYTTGRSGSIAQGSPRLGARVAKLQGDESPALSFLARRGSEAQNNNSEGKQNTPTSTEKNRQMTAGSYLVQSSVFTIVFSSSSSSEQVKTVKSNASTILKR
jgi:hypothetical protein